MEKEVLENLLTIKPLINGKKWMDIGTRNGLNMISLTKCGATSVIGIDINSDRFGEFDKYEKTYPTIKLIKRNLYDMDPNKKFNGISVFLWDTPFLDYDKIMIKIKELLLPKGIVLIGVYDQVLKEHYPYENCFVYQTFKKHFASVIKINKSDYYNNNNDGQWIFKLERPIKY